MMMDGVWERHSMRQCATATVNVKAWRYVHPVCIYTLNSVDFYAFLSTFLLKSLPGSSLWLVLLPKNPKP
jgi:hypothetical protein